MKISGFTMLRNGVRFDYPFRESILSLLPLVDELIINIGIGDDSTKEEILKLAGQYPDKIRWIESTWDLSNPEKKRGGLILSEQTNIALKECKGDWCFYLQADEILHEEDYSVIRKGLEEANRDSTIEGILFNYVHFYGSFNVVQKTRGAYRREVRIVRRSALPKSVGDAQSFRKDDGSKLAVLHIPARIFHYGWVRTPDAMKEKTFFMDQLYHGTPDPKAAKDGIPHTGDNYRYKRFWGLQPFTQTHPDVMKDRIDKKGWTWDLAHSSLVWSVKDLKKIILDSVEKLTGIRLFEYRSYILKRSL